MVQLPCLEKFEYRVCKQDIKISGFFDFSTILLSQYHNYRSFISMKNDKDLQRLKPILAGLIITKTIVSFTSSVLTPSVIFRV